LGGGAERSERALAETAVREVLVARLGVARLAEEFGEDFARGKEERLRAMQDRRN